MNAYEDIQLLLSINNESLISVGGESSSELVLSGAVIPAGLGFCQRSCLIAR